jgi:hypothetical protein
MKIHRPSETSASGSQPSSRAATRYSLALMSSAAASTALPAIKVTRLEYDPRSMGAISESQSAIVTSP